MGHAPAWFINHEISERYRIPLAKNMDELPVFERERCITRMRAYAMANRWQELRDKAKPKR